MTAGDVPLIFGDFNDLVIAGLGVNGLEVYKESFALKCDTGVDGADLGFVSVKGVVMVAEKAAEH